MSAESWLDHELQELDEAEQFIHQTMSNFVPSNAAVRSTERRTGQSAGPSNQVTSPKANTDVDKLTNELIQGLAVDKQKQPYDSFNLPPPPDLDEFIIPQNNVKPPKSSDLAPPPFVLNDPPRQEATHKTKSSTMSKTAPPPILPKPSRSTALKARSAGVNQSSNHSSSGGSSSIPAPAVSPPSVYTLAQDIPALQNTLPVAAAGIPKGIEKNSAEELDFLTANLLSNMENPSDKDFYGYCEKCNMVVEGEKVGCNALDTVFHIKCFTCITCDKELHGDPFYAVEKKTYCEPCYIASLETCTVCSQAITDRILRATGKPYHASCFKCAECGKNLDGIPFTLDDSNKVYCVEDYHQKYAPRCCVCQLPILPEPGKEETVRIVALERDFHVKCYKCEKCEVQFSTEQGCFPLNDHIYCRKCNESMTQQAAA